MSCPSCGYANPDSARFCNECASPLAAVCASCGEENPRGARFCNQCATPLGAADGRRDPRAYTPKHLADKILQSKSALEGERKQVTVLFADVKDSMRLARQLDAEEWHRILDRFFSILSEGVHRFEGTVNQYLGDGIMALFGAPVALEDHAQRACYAALGLRDPLRAYADELRRERGLNLAVRMGLNSGEVVVGKIGDDLRMDFTAQGHAVGLAQRMEEIAPADSACLTEHTARLVGGSFELRNLGAFDLKGAASSVTVHELVCAGSHYAPRRLAPFVGRRDEMATLEAGLERALEGHGQVLGVVAEAGTGKSRLCLEFEQRCRARRIPVYDAHCPAHGKAVPLLPILDLLRGYLGIETARDPRQVRERIAGRLLLLDATFEPSLPLLFELLGVADPEQKPLRLDATARQHRLNLFLQRLVRTQSAREPTLFFIDDLHWIDDASDGFVAQMVEAVQGTRVLMLVNYRPEYRADWTEGAGYRSLALRPLGPEESEELVRGLLGSDPSLAGLAGQIHARTQGNPFFTEEIVQSLIESGQLEGGPGAYRLTTSVEELRVPPTVQAVLQARIDRLAELDKRVLQVASVIGREFSEPLLESAAGLPAEDLRAALASLQSAELVFERALYPVAEYAFKHPLTHAVALESQLTDRRRRIHAAVARAIETLNADGLDEQAALLAHHWEAAGDALTAARWHGRAAERVARIDQHETVRHWSRVRELTASLRDVREARGLGGRACARLLLSGVIVGTWPADIRELYEEGRTLADGSADPSLRLLLDAGFGRALCSHGDTVAALDIVRELWEHTRSSDDGELRSTSDSQLVDALYQSDHHREALSVIDAVLPSCPRNVNLIGFLSTYGHLWLMRGGVLCSLGRSGEAREAVTRTLEIAAEEATPNGAAWAYSFAVMNCYFAGDTDEAVQYSRRHAMLARELGDPLIHRGHVLYGLAMVHLVCGRPTEAIEAARRALEAHVRNEKHLASLDQTLDAEGLLLIGDFEGAHRSAAEAIALARRYPRPLWEAWAQGALARSLLRTRGAASASDVEAALARAATLIEQTGGRVLLPRLAEWRAELAGVLHDDGTRERELREAHRLYVEFEATAHAERLGRELGS